VANGLYGGNGFGLGVVKFPFAVGVHNPRPDDFFAVCLRSSGHFPLTIPLFIQAIWRSCTLPAAVVKTASRCSYFPASSVIFTDGRRGLVLGKDFRLWISGKGKSGENPPMAFHIYSAIK